MPIPSPCLSLGSEPRGISSRMFELHTDREDLYSATPALRGECLPRYHSRVVSPSEINQSISGAVYIWKYTKSAQHRTQSGRRTHSRYSAHGRSSGESLIALRRVERAVGVLGDPYNPFLDS